jgi:hypothetical protein
MKDQLRDFTSRINFVDGDHLFSDDEGGREESRTTYDEHEVKYESNFEGLPRKGKDIDDIFYKYSEWSKDNGFKITKSLRKAFTRGFNGEYAVFSCQFGMAKALKTGGYKNTPYKNLIAKA